MPREPEQVSPLANVSEARFDAAGETLAYRTSDGRLVVRDVAARADRFSADAGSDGYLRFDSTGKLLIAERASGGAEVWRIADRQRLASLVFPPGESIEQTHFAADGSQVAIVVRPSDVQGRSRVVLVRLSDGHTTTVEDDMHVAAAAVSDDGTTLIVIATSMFQTRMRAIDVATGRELARKSIDGSAEHVVFHPAGTAFAMTTPLRHIGGGTSGRETLLVHSLESPLSGVRFEERARIPHDGDVTLVQMSGDGRFLASRSDDHTVQVWGLFGGAVGRVRLETKIVLVSLSESGQLLAIRDDQSLIQLFDVASGEPAHEPASAGRRAPGPSRKCASRPPCDRRQGRRPRRPPGP
jgi:WD40 repeat protein